MLAKCFWLWCFRNLAQLLKNRQMSLQLSLWRFLNQRAENKISKHYWQISLTSYLLDLDREISWWSTVSWFGTSHPMSLTTIRRQPVNPARWLSRKIAKFSLCILGSSWIHYLIDPWTLRGLRSCCPSPARSWRAFGWCWISACKALRAYFRRLRRMDLPTGSGARRSAMRACSYSLGSTG